MLDKMGIDLISTPSHGCEVSCEVETWQLGMWTELASLFMLLVTHLEHLFIATELSSWQILVQATVSINCYEQKKNCKDFKQRRRPLSDSSVAQVWLDFHLLIHYYKLFLFFYLFIFLITNLTLREAFGNSLRMFFFNVFYIFLNIF